MSAHPQRTLAVIGAGPKGLAIAAKAAVLHETGYVVPRIVIFDGKGVAANWTGSAGYTHGMVPLGTPPEKDVGFPYESFSWDDDGETINRLMLKYSWQAFLTSGRAHGVTFSTYSGWIDRGRPAPTHGDWAKYLQWVGRQVFKVDSEIRFVSEDIVKIDLAQKRWKLTTAGIDHPSETMEAESLVITGPGPANRRIAGWTEHPLLKNGASFWEWAQDYKADQVLHVGVVGAGETAAAIVASLLSIMPRQSTVDVICPQGMVYSRGESYDENRFFSDPSTWRRLAESHRIEFVSRTDRGVFSRATKARLDGAWGITLVPGIVNEVAVPNGDVEYEGQHEVVVQLDYDGQPNRKYLHMVVDATGFDQLWFERLFTRRAQGRSLDAISNVTGIRVPQAIVGRPTSKIREYSAAVQRVIDQDLSLKGLAGATLHLPMLAGMAQGPGFPNLSCLGLVSDRILRSYARKSPAKVTVTRSLKTKRTSGK